MLKIFLARKRMPKIDRDHFLFNLHLTSPFIFLTHKNIPPKETKKQQNFQRVRATKINTGNPPNSQNHALSCIIGSFDNPFLPLLSSSKNISKFSLNQFTSRVLILLHPVALCRTRKVAFLRPLAMAPVRCSTYCLVLYEA